MTAVTSSQPRSARPRVSTGTAVLIGALSVLAAMAASAIVAGIAVALGADPSFGPLLPPVFLAFSAAGTIAGLLGWVLIARRAAHPGRLLRVLVPVLVVLSLVPDVALLILGFIPGSSPTAVVALMLMHPIAAVSAVIGGRRIAPVR
ncbi:DUF6069 family protein [Schumannella sp. 10F1B-5-1]|uniref:DUF6069 family protein n=1 Tax=Schumannella sp. 10F1B-5-1 TaxID=2590780 RepID=UPI0011324FCD|nr:DUF6069 family protein [Schumannella sp. 10F1B-5-1]TPW76796.1 hypothetical protein FJ658_02320 [Schumannella sp. 10F1B-5-1]